MRRFNAGKFLVVCCFCVWYGTGVFVSSTTIAKRDVAAVNDTSDSVDGNNLDGDGGGGGGAGNDLTSGLVPGEDSTLGLGSVLPNEAVDAFKNITSDVTGSNFNSTGDLSNPNNLINDAINGTGFGSNLTDIDSADKKNQTEGSENETENNNEYQNQDGLETSSAESTLDEQKNNQTGFANYTETPVNNNDTTFNLDNLQGSSADKWNQSIPSTSGLDTDDSQNWPNDQGSDQEIDTLHRIGQNSSQSENVTSPSSSNLTSSGENVNSSSSTSDNIPNSAPQPPMSTPRPPISTTPSLSMATKYTNAYWIPIFNFDNDFYFLTHKGYAKLVNFPPPVIYSFTPVPLRKTIQYSSKPTPTKGQPRREDESFSGNFFDTDSSSFADCYQNANIGNLIPYSYFGSWVAVFHFENGWNLQTYDGYVPLDLYDEEAPIAYEFVPSIYDLSTPTSLVEQVAELFSSTQPYGAGDMASWSLPDYGEGLATWSEPIVVED